MEKFFDGKHVELPHEVLAQVLWDNPTRLYGE